MVMGVFATDDLVGRSSTMTSAPKKKWIQHYMQGTTQRTRSVFLPTEWCNRSKGILFFSCLGSSSWAMGQGRGRNFCVRSPLIWTREHLTCHSITVLLDEANRREVRAGALLVFLFFFSAFSYSFPSSTHSLRAQSRSLLADQSTLWCLCPRQGQAELRDVYCFPRRVSWLIRPW